MIKTNDDVYLIKIYFNNSNNASSALLELIIIQIIIVILILIITFIYTRQTVLKPINLLIEDIRNFYK